MRLAEGGAVRPVSPQEAARGRLDYVRVKEWGSGDPAELDSLKVESFQQGVAQEEGRPFYEVLARRLELLQVGAAKRFEGFGLRRRGQAHRTSVAQSCIKPAVAVHNRTTSWNPLAVVYCELVSH